MGAVLAVLLGPPAHAHLPTLRGRLVDLVQRSDMVLLGTVTNLQPVGARQVDVAFAVHAVLAGSFAGQRLTLRAPAGLAPAMRYVVFLRHTATGFESIAPSGTVFPSRLEDDADYQRVVKALRAALTGSPTHRIAAVRAALIAALSASAPPLRYHAALELSALIHDGHGPTDSERTHLDALLANAAVDPGVRALLIAPTPPP